MSVDYLSLQRIEALFWRVLVIALWASNFASTWQGASEAFGSCALAFFSVASAALANVGAIEVVALWRVHRRVSAMSLCISTVVAAIVTCAIQIGYLAAHVKVGLLQVGPFPIGFDLWVFAHGLGQPLLCILLTFTVLFDGRGCKAEVEISSRGRELVSSCATLEREEPDCLSSDTSFESVVYSTSVRQPLAFGARSMPYTRSYAYSVPSQAAAEAGRDRCPIPGLCRRSICSTAIVGRPARARAKTRRYSRSLGKTRAPPLSARLRNRQVKPAMEETSTAVS